MSTDVQMAVDPIPSPPSDPRGCEPEKASDNSTTSCSATAPPVANQPTRGTSRLEKVSPKDLCDFEDALELVWVMFGAIYAHKKLYEDAGILHGDINPNTIVMLETEDGHVEGGLIDYDMPLCRAAMRKLANPDPVVPPPAVRPPQFFRPAYYHY
ncbi:hypothetical protein GSI_11207 [Ganoderma sinense ZZ0214-1]|uniref:Fungal-type protein kinase domain-containing protein n=1 Tax=Ganoderma sinense ZZ0214-1 TaxID=1077348 RepID=A0A2G8RZJ4_9APHY|nr:hypothetical protein GSI_11207 [Ganoderma sinense ZZ0214-1]